MRNRTKLLSLVAACSVLSLAQSAHAECREDDQKAPITFHIEHVKGERVVILDSAITICHLLSRPAVAYITTPKTIDYTWVAPVSWLDPKLLPRILDSVKQAPLSSGGSR